MSDKKKYRELSGFPWLITYEAHLPDGHFSKKKILVIADEIEEALSAAREKIKSRYETFGIDACECVCEDGAIIESESFNEFIDLILNP